MGRNRFFSHRSNVYLIPVLFIFAIAACTKPQITFTSVYNGDNSTNVVQVDTFSVQLTTVFLDSFTTSGTATQLIGRYNDPYFGRITSQSYTDIGVPSPLPVITNYSIYDSIQLIMRIDRSYYGDTSRVQHYSVSQLTQVMNYPGTQKAFFNNNSIPFSPTVLGSTDIQINPTGGITSQRFGDTVKFTMPQSMGEELFGLLYRQPDTIKNASIFRGYFKGLTVYPDTTKPGAVFGFKDTMALRIYYHEPGVVTVRKTTEFRMINQNTQFNQISVDRIGTPTESLTRANPELPSTASGNKAFLQPITSLYIKMLFPTISNLLGYPDYLAIMKAQLVIKPVQGTYDPVYRLPPQVNLSLTNQANTIGATLPLGGGNLNIDYLYGANTNYSWDITPYIQSIILQGAPNNAKNGLMIVVPATLFNTTLFRAVIGDSYNLQKSNRIILNIYYASYY